MPMPDPTADFDTAALHAWLLRTLPDLRGQVRGPMRVQRVEGGQSNPTFFISFDKRELVLRKQPGGELLPSAHAVDREYRVLRALAGSDVPVPQALAMCDDRGIIGTSFYVMARLHGHVMPALAMPELASALRRAHVMAMAQTLARLHAVDVAAVGLADYGRPGNYFERQVARWTRQWQATQQERSSEFSSAVERIGAWLSTRIPASQTSAIAHGDFRLGNLMFEHGAPRVLGVLDWELSTLGHPLADVAYCCMAWQMQSGDFDGVRDIDLAAGGLPSMEEFIAHYQACGGCSEPMLPFHLVFSMFRIAVILDGVAARGRAGNAASSSAANVGARASAYAQRALELMDGTREAAPQPAIEYGPPRSSARR